MRVVVHAASPPSPFFTLLILCEGRGGLGHQWNIEGVLIVQHTITLVHSRSSASCQNRESVVRDEPLGKSRPTVRRGGTLHYV